MLYVSQAFHITTALPVSNITTSVPHMNHRGSFTGTKFRRIIPDVGPASQKPADVKRVIFCTGKVYYELAKERKQHSLESHVAIIRLEQVMITFHWSLELQLRELLCKENVLLQYTFNMQLFTKMLLFLNNNGFRNGVKSLRSSCRDNANYFDI